METALQLNGQMVRHQFRLLLVPGRPTVSLPEHSAIIEAVAYLIAMRDLALDRLLPALPAGPVTTGMTFDGSADLADLITGGTLVDFKAGQGGNPRADQTRAASLARSDLHQLPGYASMDYSATHRLNAVAMYAVRLGYFAAWPLDQLCTRMAGHPADFPALRREFAHVLRVQLPAQRIR